MNIERFHNELAMRLGYVRIVKDKKINISVEESDDPWVTIKMLGCEDLRFKASGKTDDVNFPDWTGMDDEIQIITDAVHKAYQMANKKLFDSKMLQQL